MILHANHRTREGVGHEWRLVNASIFWGWLSTGRGRDWGFPRPPAQIRASRITAPGSYLEFERRNASKAKDDRFGQQAAIATHGGSSEPRSVAVSGCVAEAIDTRNGPVLDIVILSGHFRLLCYPFHCHSAWSLRPSGGRYFGYLPVGHV